MASIRSNDRISDYMSSIELTAPAKVNLVLKVLNRRKDSYHNILTLFERISLCDRIRIQKAAKGITVTCDKRVTPKPQDNIAYKAAKLILDEAKVRSGVSINIRKRIPIAAGLGGGSSDAAAVLVGINRLFKLRLSVRRLMELGARIGADVPFFIFDAPFAVGRGIGERLEKADLNLKLHHILVFPGFKAKTKDVYRALELSREGCGRRLTKTLGGVRMTLPKGFDGLEGLLCNDLEAAVSAIRPAVGNVLKCLASSLGRRAMVSGSGPSVFCLCRTRDEALRLRKRLFGKVPASVRRRWQVFIVETAR